MERIKIRKNPVTVLANQIISMAVEYKEISDSKMYEIVKRAYPFWGLSYKKFTDVVLQLYQQGSIWYNQKTIIRKRKSMSYFLDNISMIPDEKTIPVFDSTSQNKIGTLDESFALSYCIEGSQFIMRGIPWEIIERQIDKILVTPIKTLGIIPDWAGEDIPVPFEVAMEVGKLRRLVAEKKNPRGYPGKNSFKHFQKQIEEQITNGFKVPTDRLITIERGNDNITINTHFGSKTNEAVGRIITALLSQKIGREIGLDSNQYRIVLYSPKRINPTDIKDIFLNTDPKTLAYILQKILPNISITRWYLYRVARKFGAINKDANGKDISFQGLIKIFGKMPLFEETISKTLWDKMDITHAQAVWTKIKRGKTQLAIQKISPISLCGDEIRLSFLSPNYNNKTILETLKKRLGKTRLLMICSNCYHQWTSTVSRTRLKCPHCNSSMITGIKNPDEQKKIIKILRKKNLEKAEKRELTRFLKSASLVSSYGRDALFSLAGYGVGPDTAARILAKQKKEDELLWEILNAEIIYARTKRFWDS